MSRIGKRPVSIPGGVTAAVDGQVVKVKGPKGELQHVLVDAVLAKIDKDNI
jgi:large subunit ribosomal protein L6